MTDIRRAAHDALRHTLDLAQALQEAAAFPLAYTDGDREVLAKRLRDVQTACAPLVHVRSVVTVHPSRPPEPPRAA